MSEFLGKRRRCGRFAAAPALLLALSVLSGCGLFGEKRDSESQPATATSTNADSENADSLPSGQRNAEPPMDVPGAEPAADIAPEVAESESVSREVLAGPAPLQMRVAAFNVLIPRGSEGEVRAIWRHLREDVLAADLAARLRANGLRVGVGNARWWTAIRSTLERVEGYRVSSSAPLRQPVGAALTLELDTEPRDQTIFQIGADGMLSGNTFPASRNLLRVVYQPDARPSGRIWVSVTPTIRQDLGGQRWQRTAQGIALAPNEHTTTIDSAAWALWLERDEFLVVAPSEAGSLEGLLGDALLSAQLDGNAYSSFLFFRPEVERLDE